MSVRPETPFLGRVADRVFMPEIAARADAAPGTIWLFVYDFPLGEDVPMAAAQLCGPLELTEQTYATLAGRRYPRERVAELARSAAVDGSLAVFLWVREPGLGVHTVSATIRGPFRGPPPP